MNDDLLSFSRTWDGFLPVNAVVMGRHSTLSALTENHDSVTPTSIETAFLFFAPDSHLPASRELLDKIIAALELRNDEYLVASEISAHVIPKILIRFTLSAGDAALAGHWETEDEITATVSTFSLETMLKNPGMKKPVWAHLKEALARLRGGVHS